MIIEHLKDIEVIQRGIKKCWVIQEFKIIFLEMKKKWLSDAY